MDRLERWGWRMAIGGGTTTVLAVIGMSIAIFKMVGG